VNVQELLRNPKDYNRQLVVVEGWTHSGMECFALKAIRENVAQELIWIDNLAFIKANEKRWPRERKNRATTEPVLNAKAQQKYQKLFSLEQPTHVILKGEFQTAKKGQFGDGSYKHRLILYEVISVEEQ
jgi:hypothetical protein